MIKFAHIDVNMHRQNTCNKYNKKEDKHKNFQLQEVFKGRNYKKLENNHPNFKRCCKS